ncbi:MAG: glycosyltransferase family 4 protein [Armatimonadetes bacterium]|nr:glycosyltransferase family 4 protein [Armatimonadota bacterium]
MSPQTAMMRAKPTLAVAAWGDPFDVATWSGTSANVIAALQKQGVEIIGLDCRRSGLMWRLEHNRDRLMGRHYGYSLRRRARLNCVRLAKTLPADCAGIVHISSITAPPAGSTPGFKNFLLCDAMTDFWQKCYSSDQPQETTAPQRQDEADECAAVSGTDWFFPISEHTATSLRDHYGVSPEKMTIVGTGRGQIAPLQGTKDYSRKNILMVAKQRFEDKGGPLLIEAMAIARQSDPQLHLTLVSPEEFRPFVQGAEGITLTGNVEWSELQRLFDETCLYAMPALCEPWGLVYAEALATKTPILGLNRAALPELTENGKHGFLVDEATPQAVAQTLLRAVSDRDTLQQMGESGQKYCLENFTWERTAALMSAAIWPS